MESLTPFPLQSRGGLDGVRANFNFTAIVITKGTVFIQSYSAHGSCCKKD